MDKGSEVGYVEVCVCVCSWIAPCASVKTDGPHKCEQVQLFIVRHVVIFGCLGKLEDQSAKLQFNSARICYLQLYMRGK